MDSLFYVCRGAQAYRTTWRFKHGWRKDFPGLLPSLALLGCQSPAYLLCLKQYLTLARARCFQVVTGIKPERSENFRCWDS